jgi:hypothetical protein
MSFWSGSIAVALASGLSAVLCGRIRPKWLGWLVALAGAIAIAFSVYLLAAWMSESPGSYAAWGLIGISIYSAVGLAVSAIAMFLL